ncbi:PBS lyase [Euhalothece natronophila Z-M001]|uniref:PBS lyase n=1 Tax=Euhalothece natronophila Z-M001 TaxID=522448 RepID=A0A5B8NP06_9CHRO|nr:virulence factor [Euhalothece natronophila]QDZ39925.1 PBS lyase [Euhalothece natronophila Z-M001]
MKLSSLETTPNPHCMKLNLDETIAEKPITLKAGDPCDEVPHSVAQLLNIEGVREVFLSSNFIAVIRQSQADWEPILSQAAKVFGVTENADTELLSQASSEESSSKELGEVEVAVLYFRGIPTQVRANGEEQKRVAMPDRFVEAMQRVVEATGVNYVMERYWEPYASRNGEPEAVANMVAEEVASLIDEEELQQIEKQAIAGESQQANSAKNTETADLLAILKQSEDWKERLKAIQKLEINQETFPAIVNALKDDRATIRRWASALLGASETEEAISPLSEVVLNDPSVIVRRTAGDALSDLGNPQGIPTMCQALQDNSKLVRWRAARFLYETGDESAIAPLETAQNQESEFDVRLEIKAALDRISRGEERQLPMWMRLSQTS